MVLGVSPSPATDEAATRADARYNDNTTAGNLADLDVPCSIISMYILLYMYIFHFLLVFTHTHTHTNKIIFVTKKDVVRFCATV
jgi:hypothetical protein